MADTKISALPASTIPLAGTEVLPIVQSGVTKQVSVANLTAGRDVTTANIVVSGITAGTGKLILMEPDRQHADGTYTSRTGWKRMATSQSTVRRQFS